MAKKRFLETLENILLIGSPNPEVKSGGYDYTRTKEQQAAMKKTPKTKIGSRFD